MDANASEDEAEQLRKRRSESIAVEIEALETEFVMEDIAFDHRLNPQPSLKQRIFGSINWGNPFFF